MLLAFDSTDSVQGGCTSHVATEVWRRLSEYATRGGPRLVRLNPNVPYKTRGNGALCLEIGHGRGRRALSGVVQGVELWAYEQIEEPSTSERLHIFETARETIEELRSPEAGSAVIDFAEPPSESFYTSAASTHVDATAPETGRWHQWANGRGIVGAAAAAAWRPRRGTYELIAYRTPERRGTRRPFVVQVGAAIDEVAPSSFDNWDPVHMKLRVAPNSPCPILAGVRATRAQELPKVLPLLAVEPIESWMLFVTNQASGDHLRRATLAELAPFQGVRVRARVEGAPLSRRGGHVSIQLRDSTGVADAFAFEPTKEFRQAVRGLRDGDEVEVEGSTHASSDILALEAFHLLSRAPVAHLAPACLCGRSAPSRGRRAPLRCPSCGRTRNLLDRGREAAQERIAVPTLVRRHLATPPTLAEERLSLAPGGLAC